MHKTPTQYTDAELTQIGTELVEYALTSDLLHVSEYYAVVRGIPRHTWKALIKTDVLLPYYEKAQAIIARRYVDGTVSSSIAHRFLRIYYKDVGESENEELREKLELELEYKKKLIEYDMQLKKQVSEMVSDEIKLQFSAVLQQVTAAQQQQQSMLDHVSSLSVTSAQQRSTIDCISKSIDSIS